VGDGAIGKTCLLSRITDNAVDWEADPEYEPTTFSNFQMVWEDEQEDGTTRSVEVELWDTAGQEGFEDLRKMSYPQTDLFMVGYDCSHAISLNNVENKWLPEIKDTLKEQNEDENIWFIMVGTKLDIRDPAETTVEMAKEMAKSVNACTLVETSAKTQDGIPELKDRLLTLCFMKDKEEPRPNWGSYPGDTEGPPPEIAAPAAPEGGGAAPVAPAAPPKAPPKDEPAPQQQVEQDKGCACVIA